MYGRGGCCAEYPRGRFESQPVTGWSGRLSAVAKREGGYAEEGGAENDDVVLVVVVVAPVELGTGLKDEEAEEENGGNGDKEPRGPNFVEEEQKPFPYYGRNNPHDARGAPVGK